jgi:zinc protease
LEIQDIASTIVRDGVTNDELERARNPLVNELKKLLSDNNYLMSAIISGSQEQPERLLRATTSVAALSSLTTDDVDAVARKYLRPDDGLPLVIVPKQNAAKESRLQPAGREPALSLAE